MAQGKILLVDDDPDVIALVEPYLVREGYELHVATDGRSGLEAARKLQPQVVLLDVMLPDLDGLEVCREIRRSAYVPILMLSARGDDMDKILGLEVGADDYLTKPFNPKELVARVRAMFRRIRMMAERPPAEETISRGSLQLMLRAQEVTIDGKPVVLTPLEFSLLRVFMTQPNQVLTRQDLLDKVWGEDFFGDERTVDTHVRHLRAKLQKTAQGPAYITAVWGTGYKFTL